MIAVICFIVAVGCGLFMLAMGIIMAHFCFSISDDFPWQCMIIIFIGGGILYFAGIYSPFIISLVGVAP